MVSRKELVLVLVAIMVVFALAVTPIIFASGKTEEAKFVGSKKCRLCHLKEYKTWSATRHAVNFDSLEGAEREDPDCVRCHTTGYGRPGGFVSVAETPDLTNTGCESCHGPGSEHIAAGKKVKAGVEWEKKINRTPQNACIGCHNPHVRQGERAEKLRENAG